GEQNNAGELNFPGEQSFAREPALPGARETKYDLIVSNPPYVPSITAKGLLDDGRNEPILALDGGADGLDLVRALVDNVLASLAPGGRFLVETGEYNARAAAAYMSERGFANVTIHRDLAGQDRVIEGTQK
ncbi:MAG TPA: hypothetical protein PKO22_04795, partial [Treponemataceae bacterium]|nr:hypothetical protein [Treponemataceae bacterium]